jgi:uncharacterized protein
MADRFLDTNVLLRYFTRDDEEKAGRALVLLTRVEQGQEKVVTSSLVIFETVFTLQRFYQVPRERIRDLVGDIISLRGLELPGKTQHIHALDLYATTNLSFADAYNAVYAQARGITEVYSWDTDFDRVPGLTRVEP